MTLLLGLFASGLAAGTLGALLGLGGGIFLVPVLTLVFDLPVRVAVGTSLVCVIATSAGVASLASEEGGADVPLALRLEIATAAGAVIGGLVGGFVPARILSYVFAAVVFGSAAYTLYKAAGPGEAMYRRDYTPRRWSLGYGVASLAGMVSGLLGVGGGFIKVPAMYAIMGVPLGVATATSNFMVGITAAASVFVYLGRGDVRPVVTVAAAAGVFLGAAAGTLLQGRLKVAWLRWALVLLMVAIGVQMLARGF
ncbi:MAG TPA: sulfite exporter TauE/SafE family protein [Trueperaceae bacterium]|nr:sulfite exporter TauE/SafE family protein [Trueperaceae bacterium]